MIMSEEEPTIFEYSIPIATFRRIPPEDVAMLIPDGISITQTDHFYHIPFEFDFDRDQLDQWVKNNSLGNDQDISTMAEMLPTQSSPNNQNTHQVDSSQ